MKPIKLPFGVNENNKLVHIVDVERGKKCNCICPGCGSLLIARKGDQNQHHFQHAVDKECNRGLESAVHRAAKQMIMEKKQITLSKCVVSISKKDSKGVVHTEQKPILENEKVICFDYVEEEKELYGMRVDILAKKDNTPLIIEIFYRHKVDDQKLVKIREGNISTIEINLSDLVSEDLKDLETLWSYINDSKRIQWLHNAKAHDHYPALQELLAKKIRKQEEKYKQEEIEKQAQAKQELERALYNFKRSQGKQYLEFDNRPLLLSRVPRQRGAPIDWVRLSNGKLKGNQNQSFGRRKGNRKSSF